MRFRHDPADDGKSGAGPDAHGGDGAWTVHGHLHPMLAIARGTRSVEAPAFVVDRARRSVVLPAFSKFSRGVRFDGTGGEELYAIAEGAVVGPIARGATP